MAVEPSPDRLAPASDAPTRLAAADLRAEARLDAAIADARLDDALRLDDETLAAVTAALAGTVHGIVHAIARQAERTLATHAPGTSVGLATPGEVFAQLRNAALLSDRELMRAVLTDARLCVLEPALVATRAPDDDPLLVPRLADHRDPIVRDCATAFLLADSGRRRDGGRSAELPAQAEHRLAWFVAAALAELAGDAAAAIDRVVVDATLRHLAARDEARQAGAAAVKLAVALDVGADDVAATLIDTLVEGRLRLFAALVAHAAGVDFAEAMAATIDPAPTTLLFMLRAAGLRRDALARIGLRLADADRLRDAEALADEVDAAAALSVEAARAAISPLTLHADYRVARRALSRARP